MVSDLQTGVIHRRKRAEVEVGGDIYMTFHLPYNETSQPDSTTTSLLDSLLSKSANIEEISLTPFTNLSSDVDIASEVSLNLLANFTYTVTTS